MRSAMRAVARASLALLCALAAAGAVRAQKAPKIAESNPQAPGGTSPAPFAQWLVEATQAGHSRLQAVEIAVSRGTSCTVVAATDPADVGEACDADDTEPLRTGKPSVEGPGEADPVFDVTQVLHDSRGHRVGTVGMDVEPDSMGRAAALAFAKKVRKEMEAKISSKKELENHGARGRS